MTRKTLLTLGAAAVIGALTLPALAGGWGPGNWGPGDWGPARMMQMMHGPMGGHGMRMAHGPMGGAPITESALWKSFDGNADGTVSAEEAKAGIAALQAKHDADGSGTLSKPEFEALFAEATRGFAERPFAMLDADKDSQLSTEELSFPAQMMARMSAMQGAAVPAAPAN